MYRFAVAMIAALISMSFAGVASAQDGEAPDPTVWTISSNLNLTVTQNAYSDNWKGGERGNLAWALNSLTTAEKQIFAKVFNKNTLKLGFGLTYTEDEQTWSRGEKTTDLIDLESTHRITTGGFVEPIIAFRGISQFMDRSVPGTTRFINPLDLTESIGIAKVFIKEEIREWQSRLGLAAKQIINRDPLIEGEQAFGVEFVNDLKTPIADGDILWTSKLTVFQGFYSSAKDDFAGTEFEDDWKYPDVNFENIFSAEVAKYISVNLYVQMLYDRQIDKAARFKQTLSLGFNYKLM